MSFQFPLDSVLRFRRTVEEREEAALQKIVHEIALIFENLERIEDRILKSQAARLAEVFKPLTGLELHASYGEVSALRQCRKELMEQVKKLERARDEQMNVYEAARRDRELLTSMHDKKRVAYESDRNRRAQKLLDDVYLARRSRF
ncbi:MAG: flagellar FliJ family protein [Acidobacteriaceae bacterium]